MVDALTLSQRCAAALPEVTTYEWYTFYRDGLIVFRDDGDGNGEYIWKWDHPTLVCPFPELIREPMSLMIEEDA